MTSSILKEIAELSNPLPKDFDPEDIVPDFESSESDFEEDADAGREHYVEVGWVI
jgi:protein AATF/BFR2